MAWGARGGINRRDAELQVDGVGDEKNIEKGEKFSLYIDASGCWEKE